MEYRERYLKIGATQIVIGRGEGAGSGRVRLDTGSVQTTINVLNTGSSADSDAKAVVWKGTHAANTVQVSKGSFAAAHFAGETATIASLKQSYRNNQASDSDVRLGPGCTLSGCTITKLGGTLELNSTIAALVQAAGETTILAGSPTSLVITGGAVRYRSAGTYGAATVSGGGELDFRQDLQARIGTNTTLRKGAVLRDPGKTVTFTNPIAVACELADVILDLGNTFNLQRS